MSDAADPAVITEVAGAVATLTLARPARRNVLNAESMGLLLDGLRAAAADDAVRVVVLTAIGPVFCAGADMSGAAAQPADFASSGPSMLVEVLKTLLEYPKPTIARVQGNTFGGGMGLVAACDLAVAVETAAFAFSEVRVGVAPAVVSVPCLRVMSPRSVAEFCLTGERFDAQRAVEAGLLTAAVPEPGLDAIVSGWVEQLRLGGPLSMRATRDVLSHVPNLSLDDAFAYAVRVSSSMFGGPEAVEGMAAFRDRRPPGWVQPPA